MPLRKKKSLAVLAAACLAFGMAGCQQNDVSSGQADTEQMSNKQLTTNIFEVKNEEFQEKESDPAGNDSYGSPAYPLYGDWTFEKIANLIEIDSVPLSLSGDVAYFNNINKKFKAEQDKDFIGDYHVYYDNKHIIMASKSQEKSDISFIVSSSKDSQEINDAVTFAGYSFSDADEIYRYMNENFTVSQSGEFAKRYSFVNDKLILELSFFENNDNLTQIAVSIKEEE